MELKTAIEILDYHQKWRLGKRDKMIHEAKKLTEALDIVLNEVRKLPIHNVVRKSEQLIAFMEYVQTKRAIYFLDKEELVDEYLKSN